MAGPNLSIKKRILFLVFIFTLSLIGLIIRTGWWQLHEGERLQKEAIAQQTRDRIITSKRGTIYDRNGRTLAVSASVEAVCVAPNQIKNSKKEALVAKNLSEILDMDYESIYKKVTQNSSYAIIKRKVEKDVANKVREFIDEYDIQGIYLDEDSKRYYPYGNFASHVIGVTGTDNQGLAGIELKYDKYLKGLPGRIVLATDSLGVEMPYRHERYVNSKDGSNLVLTVDEVIQHFVEKRLETAVIDNKAKCGGAAIVMDPNTGEILAMAVKPDFDLNSPFKLNSEEVINELEKLGDEERKKKYNVELQQMWRNKAVSDTYEPGSTFKIMVASSALDEGVVKPDDMFNCKGYVQVGNYQIKCWRYPNSHGAETFVQGVQNSCNPVFMEVARRMGPDIFYKYYKAFGFIQRTNIDLPGEVSGIFHNLNKFNEVELATASFGQRFTITPIQLITAVSAAVNGGKLLKPRLVKQIVDTEGNIIEDFEPQMIRQVISEETSHTVRNILESVVSEGTGKNARVKGYRVGGKTGTSEKGTVGNKYIASFIGFAPADDPKIVCLLLLDEPQVYPHSGGYIAAPVVAKIIEETLRYMEVEPRFTEDELLNSDVSVPKVENMDKKEAEQALKKANLSYKIYGLGNNIKGQTPKAGAMLPEKSVVILYTEDFEEQSDVKVPDVLNRTVLESNKILTNADLNIKITGVGSGTAVKQTPLAGTAVERGSIIEVEFRSTENIE